MVFVFRNNTIEPFFPSGYEFSGYGDISTIPSEVDMYLWCYQAPFGSNADAIAEEITGYIDQLQLVVSQIDTNKTFVIFTLGRVIT